MSILRRFVVILCLMIFCVVSLCGCGSSDYSDAPNVRVTQMSKWGCWSGKEQSEDIKEVLDKLFKEQKWINGEDYACFTGKGMKINDRDVRVVIIFRLTNDKDRVVSVGTPDINGISQDPEVMMDYLYGVYSGEDVSVLKRKLNIIPDDGACAKAVEGWLNLYYKGNPYNEEDYYYMLNQLVSANSIQDWREVRITSFDRIVSDQPEICDKIKKVEEDFLAKQKFTVQEEKINDTTFKVIIDSEIYGLGGDKTVTSVMNDMIEKKYPTGSKYTEIDVLRYMSEIYPEMLASVKKIGNRHIVLYLDFGERTYRVSADVTANGKNKKYEMTIAENGLLTGAGSISQVLLFSNVIDDERDAHGHNQILNLNHIGNIGDVWDKELKRLTDSRQREAMDKISKR